MPKRVIVLADAFLNLEVKTTKKRFRKAIEDKQVTFNRTTLSRLYVFAQNFGYTLELGSYSLRENDLEMLIENLDKMGTNPFRYFTYYGSVEKLVGELPYRPEVFGVLDIPERLLRYGHWGLDFTRI
jgi:hypothetical protein